MLVVTCISTVEIFFGASIWSITAIAIERYRNIVGAKRYQIKYTYRVRTFVVIGVVWLASFLVSSVPLYPVMNYHPTLEICGTDMPKLLFQSYSVVLVVVWYALPLVFIAFTYVRIKKRVLQSVVFRTSMSVYDDDQEVLPQASSSKERRDKRIWRQNKKTTRILTPVVILFAVTMFPLNAFRVVALIMPEYWNKPYYNLIVGQLILFVMINSSANPLVYFIMSKEFKDAFNKIFKSLKNKNNFFKQFCSSKGKSSWRTSPSFLEAALGDREENQGEANKRNKSNNEPHSGFGNGNVQIVTGV